MLISQICSSLRGLKRQKYRTLLTVTSIAIGVSAIILTVHIGFSGKAFLSSEMSNMGLDGLFLGVKEGSGASYSAADLRLIEQQEQVAASTPLLSSYTKIRMRHHSAKAMVWGVGAEADSVVSLKPLYGRTLKTSDIRGKKNVCVVDEKTAQNFYKRTNIVGKNIEIFFDNQSHSFEVVGVVESGGAIFQNVVGDYVPNFVYLPYTSMQTALNKKEIPQIAVKLANTEESTHFEAKLKQVFQHIRENPQNYTIQNMARQQETLNSVIDITTIVIAAIASISFLVAGFGMMTIMMISVKERTKEIGIKKSIGASKWVILREFLVESFTISMLGSIIGSVASVGILLLAKILLGKAIVIQFGFLVKCILATAAAGTMFGVIPSYQASTMEPVRALRHE